MANVSKLQELLEQLVKFRTIADNPTELELCASFICNYFIGCDVVVRKHGSNGKPSVIVLLSGTKEPDIFLNAHFDVVPAEDSMFTAKARSGKLYGRGVLDCKAQVAVLMMLMKEFSLLPPEQRPGIGIMLTGDEEIGGGSGVKYLLEKEGYSCKFAVVADGGENFDIVTKHKAVLHLKISAAGKAEHGSQPWLGENAADKAIAVYSGIKKLFPSAAELGRSGNKWVATMSLGRISGGDAVNRVPESAEMLLDIRYTENDSEKDILGRIKECCSSEKGVKVEVLTSAPMLNTPTTGSYVTKLKQAAEDVLKRNVSFGSEHGSTDAKYFAARGIPVAIIWSPGRGEHSSEEFVELEGMRQLYSILKSFILSCSP